MRVTAPLGSGHPSCAMGDFTPMTMATNIGSNPIASTKAGVRILKVIELNRGTSAALPANYKGVT